MEGPTVQFFSDVNLGKPGLDLAIFWASPSRPDLLLVRTTPHFCWAFVSSVDLFIQHKAYLTYSHKPPYLSIGIQLAGTKSYIRSSVFSRWMSSDRRRVPKRNSQVLYRRQTLVTAAMAQANPKNPWINVEFLFRGDTINPKWPNYSAWRFAIVYPQGWFVVEFFPWVWKMTSIKRSCGLNWST